LPFKWQARSHGELSDKGEKRSSAPRSYPRAADVKNNRYGPGNGPVQGAEIAGPEVDDEDPKNRRPQRGWWSFLEGDWDK